MKQNIIYSALFSFALAAAAPAAIALDHGAVETDKNVPVGAYQPGDKGSTHEDDTHSPTDPRDRNNSDGAGAGSSGAGGSGTGTGTGSGTGTGTSGGAGSTGDGTGGAGSGGASGAGAGQGG